VAIRTYALL